MGTLASHSDRSSVLGAIGAWWRDYLARSQMVAELAQFSPAEMDRMAHDVGVSTADLYDLAQHAPGSADEMPRMMVALDLDPAAVARAEPESYRDMQRLCSLCEAKGRCDHDLAAGTAEVNYQQYCLNAATLQALKAIRLYAQR